MLLYRVIMIFRIAYRIWDDRPGALLKTKYLFYYVNFKHHLDFYLLLTSPSSLSSSCTGNTCFCHIPDSLSPPSQSWYTVCQSFACPVHSFHPPHSTFPDCYPPTSIFQNLNSAILVIIQQTILLLLSYQLSKQLNAKQLVSCQKQH